MNRSAITESIVYYAEHTTAVEGKVQSLEDRLNQLEIGNHQHPPQIAYYAPESAYYTRQQPAAGILPTINVPPPAQYQWTGQTTFQQQGQNPKNKVRNGYQRVGQQPFQFIHSPNVA